jgi:hypothetical protein
VEDKDALGEEITNEILRLEFELNCLSDVPVLQGLQALLRRRLEDN